MPRGPSYSNEKGFHHHNRQEKNGLERRTSNPYGQSAHGKRFHHDRFGDRNNLNTSYNGRRDCKLSLLYNLYVLLFIYLFYYYLYY